jgi:hypothetical protein
VAVIISSFEFVLEFATNIALGNCCPAGQKCCTGNVCCVVPEPNLGNENWSYLGCYQDGVQRALEHSVSENGMTVERCWQIASAHLYSGVEYGV